MTFKDIRKNYLMKLKKRAERYSLCLVEYETVPLKLRDMVRECMDEWYSYSTDILNTRWARVLHYGGEYDFYFLFRAKQLPTLETIHNIEWEFQGMFICAILTDTHYYRKYAPED